MIKRLQDELGEEVEFYSTNSASRIMRSASES